MAYHPLTNPKAIKFQKDREELRQKAFNAIVRTLTEFQMATPLNNIEWLNILYDFTTSMIHEQLPIEVDRMWENRP